MAAYHEKDLKEDNEELRYVVMSFGSILRLGIRSLPLFHFLASMARHLLSQALPCLGRESGSANTATYSGSRKVNQRYEYRENSWCGFVELQPSFVPTPEEFLELLQRVPDVATVTWQSTKASQRNVGDHYCEQNIFVTSRREPDHRI